MLRYFIALNLWCAFSLFLLLAKGSTNDENFYSVLGFGHIAYQIFWFVVMLSFALAIAHWIAWSSSRKSAA